VLHMKLEIKDGKYYTMLNYPNEQKKYAYYKIPDNQIFQLKPVFNYSDAYVTIEFELDLYLQIVKNDSYSFSLVLNNSDYDDDSYNKYNVSINALKYYFSNLTLDGLYRSYEDYSGNCFDILYVNGKETWKKNYYHDGTLKNYAHGDTLLEYNESGKLFKETIGNNFKVFDAEGKIIDSKEIRDNYNIMLSEYNRIKDEYNSVNNTTNEIIKNDFCIDISSGQYINQYQCYTSDNEYIGEAFKILHLDYITAWKALIPEYEKLNGVENSLQWKSNIQFLEKIDVLNGYVDFYNKNLSLIKEFSISIDKFKELLKSPDVKKINKSLKKASTSSEIKSIIGI